jgi:hypothetical protein
MELLLISAWALGMGMGLELELGLGWGWRWGHALVDHDAAGQNEEHVFARLDFHRVRVAQCWHFLAHYGDALPATLK